VGIRYQRLLKDITNNMQVNGNHLNFLLLMSKGKAIPVQAYYKPRGFKEVEASRFKDSWYMKVVRLSALCTSHVYTPLPNNPGS
jgi:hypothetical protein